VGKPHSNVHPDCQSREEAKRSNHPLPERMLQVANTGILVQLVEIPGLLSGAAEGHGGGRALLGVLRGANAIVYCQDVAGPYEALQALRNEVALAGIGLPTMLAATKMDEANEGDLAALQVAVPDLLVVGVSIVDDESLIAFKEAVWKLTGLIRVYLRHNKHVDEEPLAMERGGNHHRCCHEST
jgi:ribosome-interacting GTPase 1